MWRGGSLRAFWLGLLVGCALGCGGEGGCPEGLVRVDGHCVVSDAGPDAPMHDGGECTPTAETCDGADEDCDGNIDEDLFRPCGVDVGTCTLGEERCILGEWLDCDAAQPAGERCAGDLDEDCDGSVDEGCECEPGATSPCGPDPVGVCQPGTQTCGEDGTLGPCEGAVLPGDEICNGLDDDCSGAVDDLTAAPCGSDVGACRSGVQACVDAARVCEGEVPPADERCNGADDDCDGRTDEGVQSAYWPDVDGDGFGDAASPRTLACAPPAELTNPVPNDDDCDDACASCFDGAPELCDGLNNDCDMDAALDEGIGSCVFGTLVACATTCGTVGRGPCDGTCEPPDLAPTCAPPAEICNGVDEDCDGIEDEDLRTLAVRPTLGAGLDGADDVRVVPTRHGFVAVVKVGRRLFAQRLDPDGTPRDASRRIDTGDDVQFFDAARLSSDRVVVTWNTTDTDELRARQVRDTGGRPANASLEAVVDAAAERFADVAVDATADHVLFAYGRAGTRRIRVTRTPHSLVGGQSFDTSRVLSLLGAGDLDVLAHDEPVVGTSEADFTLAWQVDAGGSEGDVFAAGVVVATSGQPTVQLARRFAPCRHPTLAHAGGRATRVLGCVDGTTYRIWNLTDDTGPDGPPGAIDGVVAVTRGSQRTHALTYAGGRFVLAGETRPAAGFETFVGVREIAPTLAQVGATSRSPRAFSSAHVATSDGGQVVVLTARDGSGTIPYELACE